MATLYNEICKGFGLQLKKTMKTRDLILCETNDGIKALKKCNQSMDSLLFMHSVKEHLVKKGFKNIDRYYSTIYNTPYYEFENEVYTLSNWIEGRACDFENITELYTAIKNLALFHNVARNLQPIQGSKEKNEIGKTLYLYEKRSKEIGKLKKRVLKRKKSEFDLVVLQEHEFFYELSQQAIELLKHSSYFELVKKANQEKTFCHHNYTYHNLLLGKNDEMWVVDFDHCCYEIHLYDIADVIKRKMRKCNWDYQQAVAMIDIYNQYSEYPIGESERKVLCAFFMFPNKFWKLANRYYNSKRGWALKSYMHSLNLLNEQKEHYILFIEQWKTECGIS